MTQVQQQYYANKTYKKTLSKVTTAKSSRKLSTLPSDFEGLLKSQFF